MMTSILEPSIKSVLLLSLIFIASCVIILLTLRKFGMRIASSCFSILFLIVGAYIPFYFLGTLAMNAIAIDSDSSFSFFFLKNQLALLNAPFAIFESANFFVGIIALLAAVALIIAAVVVVKVVINAIKLSCKFYFNATCTKNNCFVHSTYIPNNHNTYLVTRRLRN